MREFYNKEDLKHQIDNFLSLVRDHEEVLFWQTMDGELSEEDDTRVNLFRTQLDKDMSLITTKTAAIIENIGELDEKLDTSLDTEKKIKADDKIERQKGQKGVSTHWKTNRLNKVDLSILRLALYEILMDEDIPAGVAINEAVELAKIYSGDRAPAFINGVLAKFV
jgi:N utilization substance protein B